VSDLFSPISVLRGARSAHEVLQSRHVAGHFSVGSPDEMRLFAHAVVAARVPSPATASIDHPLGWSATGEGRE